MPHVHANGIDIHYTVEGAGPPVILLHGATSAADEDWAAEMDGRAHRAIARHCRWGSVTPYPPVQRHAWREGVLFR